MANHEAGQKAPTQMPEKTSGAALETGGPMGRHDQDRNQDVGDLSNGSFGSSLKAPNQVTGISGYLRSAPGAAQPQGPTEPAGGAETGSLAADNEEAGEGKAEQAREGEGEGKED